MRTERITILAVASLMLLSAFMTVPVSSVDSRDGNNIWAEYRDFYGYIGGLNQSNYMQLDLNETISVTATDTNATPPADILGPWIAEYPGDWNLTTLEFHVRVDIDKMDYSLPFMFELYDWYGKNESGGGMVNIPMPFNFTKSPAEPYHIPNGTLFYTEGVFGDLSLKVINGTSGEPLEGVGLNFPKHPPRSTTETGLRTNESGMILVEDLQIGLDNIPGDTSNNVTINIDKDHFNTQDGTGTVNRVIREGKVSHYEITLIEDDLLQSFTPSPGSTGVESNRTKTNIFLQFHDRMLQASVNQNTVFIEEEGGSRIDIQYDWNPTGDLVNLVPLNDLKYNTTYTITVTPRVKNLTGSELLWRTFTTSFTTHLEPPHVSGTVYVNETMEPAPEGSYYKLDNGPRMMLQNGQFNFTVREDSFHEIEVFGPTVGGIDEYLYKGAGTETFILSRGETLVIDTLRLVKQPVRTVRFNVVAEGSFEPLGDAMVTNLITDDMLYTDENGTVEFEDIRRDLSTPFKAYYPNYDDDSFSLPPADEDLTVWNITLIEDPLPIEIKARGRDVDIVLTEGVTVDVDSRFILDLQTDMDPETMNVDNIMILGPGGVPVALNIRNETGSYRRWFVDPRSDLEYSTEYTLLVKEQIATSEGENPLWRDLSISFITEGLIPAAVNGNVYVGEKPVGGIEVKVMWGGEVLGSAVTGSNGYYSLDIPMDRKELTGVSVVANGSKFGLETVTLDNQILRDGLALNDTDFRLERLPGWISILYPKDDLERMEVDGSIDIIFSVELQYTDLATLLENFTLRSTIYVDLDISVSSDNRTVTLTPTEPLDHNTEYILAISNFEQGEFHRELMSVSGLPALIRGETRRVTTEFAPIEVIMQRPTKENMENVDLNVVMTLYFTNYEIDQDLLESSIELLNVDNGSGVDLTFDWTSSGRSVDISHPEFQPITEYQLIIPSGVYGYNGERIEEDFLFQFTTENRLRPDVYVTENFPSTAKPGPVTITVTNPLGKGIRLEVFYKRVDEGDARYELLSNLTIAGFEERQLNLDFTGEEEGEITILFRITDPSKENAPINEYTRSLILAEGDENGGAGGQWWLYLVIAVFVLVIIFLAVFLYTQSKKKDIEEELKEEFECPECHNLVGPEDTVCPHCGAEFEEEAYRCPKCGEMLDPEDEVCGECGYDFSDQEEMELEDEDEYELEEEEPEMELEEDEPMEEEEFEEEEELEEIEELEEED
ncbi:MAG: Ig-like domain-containing protein [Thermoplasmatota archaeon]